MLSTFSILTLAGIVAVAGPADPGFTDSEIASWLAVAAFVLVVIDRAGALWDRHIRQRPDPRDAYEPKGSAKQIKAEVEKDMNRLTMAFKEGLSDIKSCISDNGKEMAKIEKDAIERDRAAKLSRLGIHKDIEEMKQRTAKVEVGVDHLQQQQALAAMKRHHD